MTFRSASSFVEIAWLTLSRVVLFAIHPVGGNLQSLEVTALTCYLGRYTLISSAEVLPMCLSHDDANALPDFRNYPIP
jgi:hypothetical protein